MRWAAAAAGLVMTTTLPAAAQIVRGGAPASPISSSALVPAGATTLYVSGMLADPVDPAKPDGDHGDTEAQTRSVLKKINAELARYGMGPGDVVMMRVVLVAPPGQPKMDFAGMMKAYKEVYGTAAQPAKPARIAMQIAALAAPWGLVEIEVQAARTGAMSK
ncbi:Rid family hydrolase [Sphingomonas bacterium]|uniref:Rid family hydrolase n=1 Tax=Sphingomonas bacterium TaxID=1895847 RepID=UPI0020C61C08|nr:Rid family hydrolase [Sphingomonas bacterium]